MDTRVQTAKLTKLMSDAIADPALREKLQHGSNVEKYDMLREQGFTPDEISSLDQDLKTLLPHQSPYIRFWL